MSTAGIRDLKARVSYYVRRAQSGVRVTITDRGRPIAVLGPVEHASDTSWARTLVAEGSAEWHGGKPAGLSERVKNRGRSASSIILEDRR
jgi:prevent-host-death family protein